MRLLLTMHEVGLFLMMAFQTSQQMKKAVIDFHT